MVAAVKRLAARRLEKIIINCANEDIGRAVLKAALDWRNDGSRTALQAEPESTSVFQTQL
jgi:hypothetical protein